jgi:mitofusin
MEYEMESFEKKYFQNILYRTSNGKSSVINAMLGSRILPQGMGHTTCCFLQVEGGNENEKYFVMEGDDKKIPISELVNISFYDQ